MILNFSRYIILGGDWFGTEDLHNLCFNYLDMRCHGVAINSGLSNGTRSAGARQNVTKQTKLQRTCEVHPLRCLTEPAVQHYLPSYKQIEQTNSIQVYTFQVKRVAHEVW